MKLHVSEGGIDEESPGQDAEVIHDCLADAQESVSSAREA